MKKILLVSLILLLCSPVFAATNTWQAGGVDTNWNTAGNWSDGVPTADDNCVLPASIGACIINAAAVCRSLDASAYDNTLTHNAAITLTIGDATAGAGSIALAFSAGMTYTLGNVTTSAIAFISTSATQQTISFNGKTTGNVTYDAASNGDWALTTAHNTGVATTVDFTKGTLHTDGVADDSGLTHSWGMFNSNNSNVRAIYLGNSNITLTTGGTSNAWNSSGEQNFTLNAGTSTITFGNAATNTDVALISPTKSFYNLVANTGYRIRFQIGGCFDLTFTGEAQKNVLCQIHANFTASGTLTLNGNSATNRLLVFSNTLGTARTITNTNAITGSNVDFRDITVTTASNLSAITGGSGDCGGNTGITFTTATDWFWDTAGAGTYNMENYLYWFTATNGGGTQMASTRVPLPQDNCFFDASSVTGATTVDQNMPRVCKTLDFTGVGEMAFHINNLSQTIFGGLTFVSNVTVTAGNISFELEGRDSFNFTSAGKDIGFLNLKMIGGTLVLQDDLTLISQSNSTLTLSNGHLDAATNNVTVSVKNFNSNNSNLRTLSLGNGTWNVNSTANASRGWDLRTITNLTFNKGSSTISFGPPSGTTTNIFSGGTLTYNNFTITANGTGVITLEQSNTFNTFTINAPKTVKFTAGTTTTVNSFVATGSAGNEITIQSATADSAWTITDANGGQNINDYLVVTDSNGTPASTWYYGANGSADAYSQENGWAASAVTDSYSGRGIGRGITRGVFR